MRGEIETTALDKVHPCNAVWIMGWLGSGVFIWLGGVALACMAALTGPCFLAFGGVL